MNSSTIVYRAVLAGVLMIGFYFFALLKFTSAPRSWAQSRQSTGPIEEKVSFFDDENAIEFATVQLGQYDDAIGLLREAVSTYPGNVSALIALGDVYLWNKQQWMEGIQTYEQALKLRPNLKNANLLYGLAYAYVSARTNQAIAVRLAETAVQRSP